VMHALGYPQEENWAPLNSITMQCLTAHRQKNFCRHFNFLTIHHAVLTLSCQSNICLGYWSSTWEITDSTIWGCGNGYSQM
jgi:hypothetical protein